MEYQYWMVASEIDEIKGRTWTKDGVTKDQIERQGIVLMPARRSSIASLGGSNMFIDGRLVGYAFNTQNGQIQYLKSINVIHPGRPAPPALPATKEQP